MDSRDVEICTVAEKKDQQVHNYHDEIEYTKKKRASWLVPLIAVANVVVFAMIMFVNNCPKHNDGDCVAKFLGRLSFEPRTENHLLGPSSSTLHNALEWNKTLLPNQCWRIIARMWFHSNLFQLLTNMLSLMIFGIILERQCGSVRVGLIYMLSGIGGNILSSLFIHNSTSVGASGAVFGLIGAMLSELANWAVYYPNVRSAALFNLVMVIVINFALVGILHPHIDYYMHIGGWLSGFLSGFVLCNWSDPRPAGQNRDK